MLNICLTLIDTDEEKDRFTLLYEQYRHLMFYIAEEILKDEHLSEDAVQEAFLRIAKNFYKINDIFCPQTRNFVVIITRNVAITMVKKEQCHVDLDEYIENETSESDNIFDFISEKELIHCILDLPDAYRDVLYLYHIYGYSFNEISSLLSVNVETAKKRAQRSRLMLKNMLEKEGYSFE